MVEGIFFLSLCLLLHSGNQRDSSKKATTRSRSFHGLRLGVGCLSVSTRHRRSRTFSMRCGTFQAVAAILVALCAAGVFCIVLIDITVGLFMVGTSVTVSLLFGIVWMSRACYSSGGARSSLSQSMNVVQGETSTQDDGMMAIEIPPYPTPQDKADWSSVGHLGSASVLYDRNKAAVTIEKRPPVLPSDTDDSNSVYL